MAAKPFRSADGTIRCAACGLHSDACTCGADHALRRLALLPPIPPKPTR